MIQRIHEVTTGSKLIGIHGKAGAGKDTICHYLAQNYTDVYREAFADPLKAAAAAAFGLDFYTFNEPGLKELRNDFWNVSPRQIAQFFGTEMFRNTITGLLPDSNSDFWIRRLTGTINGRLNCPLQEELLGYMPEDTIVITDVRFQNEVDWIEANGGTILVVLRNEATGNVGFKGHASEQELEIKNFWLITNNLTLEDLYERVNEFASYMKLIPVAKSKYDSSNF